jgi:hypothetical protein
VQRALTNFFKGEQNWQIYGRVQWEDLSQQLQDAAKAIFTECVQLLFFSHALFHILRLDITDDKLAELVARDVLKKVKYGKKRRAEEAEGEGEPLQPPAPRRRRLEGIILQCALFFIIKLTFVQLAWRLFSWAVPTGSIVTRAKACLSRCKAPSIDLVNATILRFVHDFDNTIV